MKRKAPTKAGDFLVNGDGGDSDDAIQGRARFSPKIFTALSALVVGVGVYSLLFSQAASTCTTTLASSASAATIQTTLENAANNSVVCLPNGVNYGNLSLNKNRTGYVTLQSVSNRGAAIGTITLSQSSQYFRFESLTIGSVEAKVNITSGTNASNVQVVDSDISGFIAWSNAQNWLAEGNYFHDCGHCIEFNTSASYLPSQHLVVRGNKFMGPNGEDMIRIANFRDVLIENNEFINNFEHTVPVSQSSDGLCHCDVVQGVWGGSDLVIRGNSILNGTGQGFFIKDAMPGTYGLGKYQNVTIENNLIVNNKKDSDSPAPQFSWGSSALTPLFIFEADNVKIFNNTVWDNDGATTLSDGVTNAVVKNNIFGRFQVANGAVASYDYNISPDVSAVSGGVLTQGSNNISGSPTFAYANNGTDLNSANWNYRLTSASKGVDKGTNTSGVTGYTVPTTDKDGNSRVDISTITNGASGFYDMGSYEYSTSGSSQTSSTCPDEVTGKCRPYDSQSPWNTQIPTNVAVDPKSSTFMGALAGLNKPLTSNPNVYTPQVYLVNSSSSTTEKVQLTDYANIYNTGDSTRAGLGQGALLSGIPIDATKVKFPNANDSSLQDDDSQYIFWDPVTGDTWEFWQFRPAQHSDAGGTDPNIGETNYTSDTSIKYIATNYTRYHTKPNTAGTTTYKYYGRLGGNGGGRGGGTPYFAGHVMPWEIAQGHIDHALAFAYGSPCCGSKSGMAAGSTTPYKDFSAPSPATQYFRYPAGKNDGGSNISSNLPPEGTRIQLKFDPSWASYSDAQLTTALQTKYNLSSAGITMAKALNKYGMYVIDNSGSSKVYVENNLTANNGAGWGNTITASTLSSIPWSDFQVVATPCDPEVSTCTSGSGTPTPTVTLSANPTTVSSGGTSALTWSTTNATSCTASGGWSGAKATSGTSVSTGALTATTTFTLNCTGTGGSTSSSTTVTVSVTSTCPTKAGDVNGDGSVNITDIGLVLSSYGQTTTTNCADLDKSGTVNIQDLSIILSKYGT